jgi:hypothetical protein
VNRYFDVAGAVSRAVAGIGALIFPAAPVCAQDGRHRRTGLVDFRYGIRLAPIAYP